MDTQQNPYATPEAAEVQAVAPAMLGDYTPAQIKKLYYRSCNVGAIAGLLIISIGAAVIGLVTTIREHGMANIEPETWGVLVVILIFMIAVIGIVMRTDWGRIAGIIACFILLLSFPLGTICGVVGLFAFFKAKELFGPARLRHREVKVAFKAVKRLR